VRVRGVLIRRFFVLNLSCGKNGCQKQKRSFWCALFVVVNCLAFFFFFFVAMIFLVLCIMCFVEVLPPLLVCKFGAFVFFLV